MGENGRLQEGSVTEDEPPSEERKPGDLQPIRTITVGVWPCLTQGRGRAMGVSQTLMGKNTVGKGKEEGQKLGHSLH